MARTALITGITGQDGSYLAEFLLNRGYTVHGIVRRSSNFTTARIDHLYQDPHDGPARLHLHFGDLLDPARLISLIREVQPDEVYNLGAQSHVRVSFDEPEFTGQISGLGVTRLLDAVLQSGVRAKVYQASTSEMFGSTPPPQRENSPFAPRSPYAAAKLYAHWMSVNYREAHGMFVSSGILFNHESPRRGHTFVTRKISQAVARIHEGDARPLVLGNLEAERDWGYAPEYVVGMWKMLQADQPDDFVLATGASYSVRDFVNYCFDAVGIDPAPYLRYDAHYERPTEVDQLRGDATKPHEALDWKAQVLAPELAKRMVEADIRSYRDPRHVDVVDIPGWQE
ncbi:GDP-mannose 4,6-dehydratase [Dermacoccaceae bacterium W4C1]